MAMNGRYNSSRCTWSSAWLFSVFSLENNSRRISLKSDGLTVLKYTVILFFSHHLCDANHVRFNARHLHQRISEHRYSAIGKHFEAQHGNNSTFLKP